MAHACWRLTTDLALSRPTEAIEEAMEQGVLDEEAGVLTAREAPLLAALWDNDEDAVYDDA